MKRRGIIVFAVAVALAFAGGAGPRHVQAATQNHDHSAVAVTTQGEHAHHGAGSELSHQHDAASKGDGHDPINGQPASDQGCCYAWCNSVAIIHAAEWLLIGDVRNEHFASDRPYRIAAFSAAIDPPPR